MSTNTKAFFLSLVLLSLVAAPMLVSAQNITKPGDLPSFNSNVTNDNLTHVSGWVGILLTIVRWVYTILFIVAVLFILLAAYNFVMSKGDPEKVSAAKKQLLYAVVGIAVGLLSYLVVTLVQNSLSSGLAG